MLNLLKKPVQVAGIMFATGILAAAQGGIAQPGTVNYVEGQVSLDGQSITTQKIGSTLVSPGHVLATNDGKAEMLLTPGVFLRLAPHSAVQMVSPSLSDTRVELVRGQTMMEVADFEKENHIEVMVGGTGVTVESRGIYEFSGNPPWARTFDGKAEVEQGGRSKEIFKGDQVVLGASNPKLKTQDFNVKRTESADDLYAWSKLRADYTAQANMSAAATYENYGPGWYGAGWYWDPAFDEYAFLLGDGFMWDPFGYGFFSPGYWGLYAPYFGYGGYGYARGGYGFGHGGYGYGHGVRPGFGGAIARNSAAGAALGSGTRGGSGFGRVAGGGFSRGGGAVRMGGGGFSRMGEGFGGMHGGGFGGGMHGGGGRR